MIFSTKRTRPKCCPGPVAQKPTRNAIRSGCLSSGCCQLQPFQRRFCVISQRQTSEARADMATARHFVDLFPPESAESSRAASPPTEETILTWISNPLENSLDHPESRPLSNSPARSGKRPHCSIISEAGRSSSVSCATRILSVIKVLFVRPAFRFMAATLRATKANKFTSSCLGAHYFMCALAQ